MDDLTAPQKVKPKHLVAGCSISHKHWHYMLHWFMFKRFVFFKFGFKYFFYAIWVGSDWVRCAYGQQLDTAAPTTISTMQTLAPNDVTNTRWQRPYPGYFGFIFLVLGYGDVSSILIYSLWSWGGEVSASQTGHTSDNAMWIQGVCIWHTS